MEEIIQKLINKNKYISSMESCTGGYIANEITNISGASLVFKFGAVTYSNEYKIKLGVDKNIIDEYTVYSIETAKEMSRTISEYTHSNYGIGITGKLQKEDINNKFGNNDEVFISIYDRDTDKYYINSTKVVKKTRQENKESIYKIVIKMLKEII